MIRFASRVPMVEGIDEQRGIMNEPQDAHHALVELLSDWPRSLDEPEAAVRGRLKGRIDGELPLESIRTVASGRWRIVSPLLRRSDVVKCLVSDSDSPGTLVIAEMRRQGDQWVITLFSQQCPVCFGSGVNDEQICDLCFGVGWGTH